MSIENLTMEECNDATGGKMEADASMRKFSARVAAHPNQVLRYARWKDDAALWVRNDQRPSDVPGCSCGAPRQFEFQVRVCAACHRRGVMLTLLPGRRCSPNCCTTFTSPPTAPLARVRMKSSRLCLILGRLRSTHAQRAAEGTAKPQGTRMSGCGCRRCDTQIKERADCCSVPPETPECACSKQPKQELQTEHYNRNHVDDLVQA